MYEFHPYFTNDGSVGLYNTDFDDIYHSATGALTEAYEKFVYPVNFNTLVQKESIKILDICYGVGYNTKSFLNYLLKNFYSENFPNKNLKISVPLTDNIEAIHTDNIIDANSKEFNNSSNMLSVYNDKIYSNNNLSPRIKNIYITAVDSDKILSLLSPFIKTRVNNIKNEHIDFDYKCINKFLNQSKSILHPKIDNTINFLLFEKILECCPEIYENNDFISVLFSKKFADYFDRNLKGIFKFYRNNIYKFTNPDKKQSFLHNIYYKYITNGYKNRLKSYNLPDLRFELKNDDARKIILEDKNTYNLIFLDAFTPAKCPCLWSYHFFKELYNHLEPDGMILTYSTSASVRSAMLEANFHIGNIFNEREDKFTGTVATKDSSLIEYPLSEFDLGLLKTRAGIFYRDEYLTGLNEAITEQRNEELRNSSRMSSSKYIKLHKEDKCTTT